MIEADGWNKLSTQVQDAHDAAWRLGMPGEASALYARWWQLETWLRSLVYVERSARSGSAWAGSLPKRAAELEQRDLAGDYMATPDTHARLAYLDVRPLFMEVIVADWALYAGNLLSDVSVWKGRAEELLRIRHRIGHCRRPHADDLNRLEQTLRDLEPGAFRAISAYNEQARPSRELNDPFVAAWCRNEHEDAHRIVDHANRQYDIVLNVRYSRRPWARELEPGAAVTGTEGYLWHVAFVFRGGYPLRLRDFWHDHATADEDSLLVYLTASDPFYVEFSFPAVGDPDALSDEVGRIFDRIVRNRDLRPVERGLELNEAIALSEAWKRAHRDLDARVQVASPWCIVDRTTTPISIFGT